LLLATGESLRQTLEKAFDMQRLGNFSHAAGDVAPRHPQSAQSVADVALHRQVREQGIVLVDDGESPGLGRPVRQVLPVPQQPSAAGPPKPGDDLQQHRLAHARRAQQHEVFPFGQAQRDVLNSQASQRL